MTYGKISKKQQEILDFIKQSILNRGYPPAVREICEAVHLKSTSRVCHLPAGFNLKKYRFCKGFPCFFLHFMV